MAYLNTDNNYPFDFSVIMAVYNVASFLREAVDSVVNQIYGFEKIQVILVDDGSTDGSGEICDEYAARYPKNILSIHKENGGVSSARNEGLKHARGRYLNFLDSDDMLSSDTMTAIAEFFKLHGNETDVVAVPLRFFDGQKGEHTLNWKFKKGNRVIDLLKEPSMIQLSMASAFIKHEAMKSHEFDTRLLFAEDAKIILCLFMQTPTLGVVKNVTYHYRKRTSGELSAIQKSESVREWYLPYLEHFQEDAVVHALKIYGYVPQFVQYTLAYDLQWRLKLQRIPEELLSPEEMEVYKNKIVWLLKHIDDEVILAQKSLWHEHKLFALLKKYSDKHEIIRRENEMYVRFGNTNCYNISNCQFTIEFITLKENECLLEGYTILYPMELSEFDIYVKVNDEMIKCDVKYRQKDILSMDEPIIKHYGFKCRISLTDNCKVYSLKFYINVNGTIIEKKNVHYKKYAAVSNKYKKSYYVNGGWKIYPVGAALIIERNDFLKHIKSELKYLKELWQKNDTGSRKAIGARLFAHVARLFVRKQIWLVSDKANRADDNGEAFFLYLQEQKNPNIVSYFLIDKQSPDYERMKKVGKVIPYMSWKHKLLYLVSDYTISAYSHDEINNPFLDYSEPYRDLLQKCKYVFLQHGIIKDDLSVGLNRYHKNINMFVCSTRDEYKSIVDNPEYGYSEDEVVLTGLPRYDRLYNTEQKEIVIMPTWRRSLVGAYHSKDSRWDLKPGFKESEYYRFFNGLINDERLLTAAKKSGYTINFVPHPVLFPYIDQFSVPKEVKLWGTEVIYREMFARNKLLITDFSSVAFDFAYLRKPVIYTHFDTNHYGEGYFVYETDGFGEVVYNLEDTISKIMEYMENDCQLKSMYKTRIDNFFAYNDRNNSQRVYERILELGKEC